jgi:hypothetical protein
VEKLTIYVFLLEGTFYTVYPHGKVLESLRDWQEGWDIDKILKNCKACKSLEEAKKYLLDEAPAGMNDVSITFETIELQRSFA